MSSELLEIELEPVASSNVAGIGFVASDITDGTGVLLVEFKNGARYGYSGVPEEVYEEMRGMDSIGRFLRTAIIPNFSAERIQADEGEEE